MDYLQLYEFDNLAKSIRFADKVQWECARWVVWSNIAPNLKPVDRNKGIEKLFPLASDVDIHKEMNKGKIDKKDKAKFIELVNQINSIKQNE